MNTPENNLIEKILGKSSQSNDLHSGLRLGIGDDAALYVARSGYETILTCDWFLEGTHFLRDRHPADSVGWKSLARAASDIAAMGGVPRCFLLSLALPGELTGRWLSDFLGGLRRASRKLQCPIAGGDTTRQDQRPYQCHGRRRNSKWTCIAPIWCETRGHHLCERSARRSRRWLIRLRAIRGKARLAIPC